MGDNPTSLEIVFIAVGVAVSLVSLTATESLRVELQHFGLWLLVASQVARPRR